MHARLLLLGFQTRKFLTNRIERAGKLDRSDFATNLNVESSGLLLAVRDSLFGWEDDKRDIKASLYKLNVYGPGSFFKTHKDTPRGSDMFGSLVLIFNTGHEGGQLVLRHNDTEIINDAASAAYNSPNQVSWVSFFSDVEHEVLHVTSGYRLTLTYNLSFVNTAPATKLPAQSSRVMKKALKKLLKDADFLPSGGRLGFYLQHLYPVPNEFPWSERDIILPNLIPTLKGADHALFKAAKRPESHHHYRWSGGQVDEGWDSVFRELGGQKFQPGEYDEERWTEDVESERNGLGSWVKHTAGHFRAHDLVFVSDVSASKRIKTTYIRYGNDASIDYVYGDIALLVRIPPASER
ncbi:hypothetical protein BKA62DRAFT_824932 [Auriculariales sp. MPI-PUGE-AT-0066]|nr:hypothetical protein BKA62DRAFT_824932 [Auriculariales sp. MPI-PUGE-AT-0066]